MKTTSYYVLFTVLLFLICINNLKAQYDSSLIVGKWVRPHGQLTGNYYIEMNFNNLTLGQISGQTKYTNFNSGAWCTGTNTLISYDSILGRYTFSVIINSNCTDSHLNDATLSFRKITFSEIQANWYRSDGTPIRAGSFKNFSLVGEFENYESFYFSKIQPNPFSFETFVTLNTINSDYISIALINTLGSKEKSIFEGFISANDSYSFTINRDGLKEGIYLLQVEGSQNFISEKIVLIGQ